MDWQEIKLSECGTFFIYQGNKVFDKTFINALKFHAPGFAPVQDENGWYHIDTKGEELYKQRYERVFGFYYNRAAVINDSVWFHIDEIE